MNIQTALFISAFGLAGCSHQVGLPDFYPAETEARFGDAVRQNIAAQTVNPNAPDGELTASGARTAIAQERYEEDKVEKPSSASTLRVTSQENSGSGGSND